MDVFEMISGDVSDDSDEEQLVKTESHCDEGDGSTNVKKEEIVENANVDVVSTANDSAETPRTWKEFESLTDGSSTYQYELPEYISETLKGVIGFETIEMDLTSDASLDGRETDARSYERELVLCRPKENSSTSSIAEMTKNIFTGRYNAVLSNKRVVQILSEVSETKSVSASPGDETRCDSDALTSLSARYETVLRRHLIDLKPNDGVELCLQCLAYAVGALHTFVQSNWTGPHVDEDMWTRYVRDDREILSVSSRTRANEHNSALASLNTTPDEKNADKADTAPNALRALVDLTDREDVLDALSCENGSRGVFALLKFPEALLLSRALFDALSRHENLCKQRPLRSVVWWQARALMAHQYVLREQSGVSFGLWKRAASLLAFAQSDLDGWWPVSSNRRDAHAAILLEGARCHLLANHTNLARQCVRDAQRTLGLDVSLTGIDGVRTKFQQKSTAQLVVLIKRLESKAPSFSSVTRTTATAPVTDTVRVRHIRVEELDEDTHLLEHVKLHDDAPLGATDRLSVREQQLLLLRAQHLKQASAHDAMLSEQIRAHVERVVVHPQDFCVHTMALLMRSRLEIVRSNTRERAILQMQTLVDVLDYERKRVVARDATDTDEMARRKEEAQNEASVEERFRNFYGTPLPPFFELSRELGGYYLGCGMVKTACAIFEKLKLWDETVSCMIVMGQSKKAERLLRKRIEAHPTPELWCLLAAVTHTKEYFHTAWTMSKQRCGRAMRQLGRMEFEEGDLESAAKHMALGLSQSPLRVRDWFLLGSIYLRLERYTDALGPYQRVVSQQSEDGHAWANLAAAHAHLGSFSEAHKAMKEALKYRSDWKMLSNFIVFAMKVQDAYALSDAIYSIRKIFEIRKKLGGGESSGVRFDPGLLAQLVDIVTSGANDDGGDMPSPPREERDESKARIFTKADAFKALLKPLRECVHMSCEELGSTDDRIWSIGANFHLSLGECFRAMDCYRQQCLTLIKRTEWRSQKDELRVVQITVKRLVNVALRTVSNEEKHLKHVRSVLRWLRALEVQIVAELANDPATRDLKASVERLERALNERAAS